MSADPLPIAFTITDADLIAALTAAAGAALVTPSSIVLAILKAALLKEKTID